MILINTNMNNKSITHQLNKEDKGIRLPKTDDAPVSASEKLGREDIKRLTENAEEIKRYKNQIEKKEHKEEPGNN